MPTGFDAVNPIINRMRSGTLNDAYIDLDESHVIINNFITISEIPYKLAGVQVSSADETVWSETESTSPSENQFKVDYRVGTIHFNPSREGQTVSISANGRGLSYIPVERIYTATENGEVVETLRDIIDAGESALVNLDTIDQVISDAEAATNAANTAASSVNTAISDVEVISDEITAAESDRVDAENIRISNESDRESAEEGRGSAESARVTAETDRVSAESSRETAESGRVSAEAARVSAENTRDSSESSRISNETDREDAEDDRISAETARGTAESARINSESLRVDAESNRASAETARGANETSRISAETSRESAESTRSSNETDRANAESARASAETARASAEDSRVTAEAGREAFKDSFVFLGDYNAGTSYIVNNQVNANGTTYICIQDSLNNSPPDSPLYWDVFASGGFTATINYSNTVESSTPTSEILIGIPEYNKDTDMLFVYQNSTFIAKYDDYVISLDSSKITKTSGTWDSDTIFNFVVLKSIPAGSETFDGSLIADETVSDDKLATDNKVGSLVNLDTTEKNSVVGAVNEVNGVRIAIGTTAPTNTVFWLDTNP